MTGAAAYAEAPTLPWRLVAAYPHQTRDFTQGLVWEDGRLFESAGQYGASRITEKDLATGHTLHETAVPPTEFGEGLALHDHQLWQLTWREGVAHIYGLDLQPQGSLRYRGEGWGLASNGSELIISDGTPNLYFVEPETLALHRKITVRDGDVPVARLNELEWVDGLIYANVWFSDKVACIDPATGSVTGWLDFSALKQTAGITPEQQAAGAVLNGLAWKADSRHLLVTGKRWPKLFEIDLSPTER